MHGLTAAASAAPNSALAERRSAATMTVVSQPMASDRQAVNAAGAPAAVGPYSHAVRAGELLFCSGQIPLDPASGEIVGETSAAQAERCMSNLQAVCAAAGTSLDRAVRLTIYMTDLAAFAEVNEVYGSFFADEPHPRIGGQWLRADDEATGEFVGEPLRIAGQAHRTGPFVEGHERWAELGRLPAGGSALTAVDDLIAPGRIGVAAFDRVDEAAGAAGRGLVVEFVLGVGFSRIAGRPGF